MLAQVFAERLRQRVVDSPLILDGRQIDLSISIGVTEIRPGDKDPDEILERADQALYQAKDDGRNRVLLYGQQ